MPRGATQQLSVNARRRPGVPGMPVDLSSQHDTDVLINSDPQAAEVYTLVIDTATDDEDYGVDLTDPVAVSVSIDSGTGSSVGSIATALAAAWNASPQARAMAEATVVTDTITFTGVFPGVAFTMAEDENAAKMTLTNTANAAEADTVPFGRAMISTSYQAGYPDPLGVIAKSTSLTAQVDTYLLTYDAAVDVSVTVTVDGIDYTATILQATDLDTSGTALAAELEAILNAASVPVTATWDTDTLTLTSDLAGLPFSSSIAWGAGRDTGAATKTTNSTTPSTDFNQVFAGISLWTYDEQQLSLTTEAAEYSANSGVEVMRRGDVWVENTQTLIAHTAVYVELDGTGDDAGKFYNDSSATRVRVDPAYLSWLRSDASDSDADVAALRIQLPA